MGNLAVEVDGDSFEVGEGETGEVEEGVDAQNDVVEYAALGVVGEFVGLIEDRDEVHGIIVIMYMMIY